MSRNSYTKKEDRLLCEYMAEHNPERKGRTSGKLYQDLVQTQPWAKGHSWQGWRERYRSQEGHFITAIENILEKRRLAAGDKETEQPDSLQPQAGPSRARDAVDVEPNQREQHNHPTITSLPRPAPHPLIQTNTEILLGAQRAKSQTKLKKRANSPDRDSGFFESSTEPTESRPSKQPEPGSSTHTNLNPFARSSQKPRRLQNTGLGNRFPNIRKRPASSDSDEEVQPKTTTWPPTRSTKRQRLDKPTSNTTGIANPAEHFQPEEVGTDKSNALPMHSTPPRAAAEKEGESSKLLLSFIETSVGLPQATSIPASLIAPTAPSTPADRTISSPSKGVVEPKSALRNPSHQRQTPRVSFSARKDVDDPFTDNTPSLPKTDDAPEVPTSHVTRSVDLRQHTNPAEPYILRMHELGVQYWVSKMTEKYSMIVPEQAREVLQMVQDDEAAENILKTMHDNLNVSLKGIKKTRRRRSAVGISTSASGDTGLSISRSATPNTVLSTRASSSAVSRSLRSSVEEPGNASSGRVSPKKRRRPSTPEFEIKRVDASMADEQTYSPPEGSAARRFLKRAGKKAKDLSPRKKTRAEMLREQKQVILQDREETPSPPQRERRWQPEHDEVLKKGTAEDGRALRRQFGGAVVLEKLMSQPYISHYLKAC